ncbi:MAG TPA: dodecin family protein [Verrucomicrobiae bacterium]|nr:dodecin family protein [Verrucomicrobiae bacterium]
MKQSINCSRELTATSVVSMEDALTNALQRAARSTKHLSTIHILEKGRHFDENHVPHWQVTLHVGIAPGNYENVLRG